MDKNQFLIFNDLIYNLYTTEQVTDFQKNLLIYLKMLIPFRYSSILLADPDSKSLRFRDLTCIPPSFEAAERMYIANYENDPTQWLMYSSEAEIIRESDVLSEEKRLHSTLYQTCYAAYQIYDSLQMSIVYNHVFIGVLTLFRTREEGAFTDDNIFLLKLLSRHLNYMFYQKCIAKPGNVPSEAMDLEELTKKYQLTRRESEILSFVLQGQNNTELSAMLSISEHTLQKHIQNIYRKTGVSSRWELLKLREGCPQN